METDQREVLHPTIPKLVNLMESAANRCLNFVQCDEYTEVYKTAYEAFKNKNEGTRPPLAGSSREAEEIRNRVHKELLKSYKEDIDHFIESENLDVKFKELDELKRESQHVTGSKKAWRPPGDAEKHMEPFNKANKVKERESLVREVRAAREKLNIMKSRVEVRRKRAVALNETVLRNKAKLEEDIIVLGSKMDEL